MKLTELRQQYPDYNDMSDQEFADAFHSKFYSDLPKEEFYSKLGVKTAQPKSSSLVDEFIEGGKGTLSAIGDVASGVIKVPAAAMLATGGKIANPDMPLQTHWENAQQAVEDTFPSIGKTFGTNENLGYTAPLKPFELYGEGAAKVAEVASMGNKDVEGAINIGANFLPIPLAKPAGRLLKRGIENIDPGLRNVEAKKPASSRMAALDEIDAQSTMNEVPGTKAGEMPGSVDTEYLAKRRAEQQAMETTVPKPEDYQSRVINDEFLRKAAEERVSREQATQGPRIDPEEVVRRETATKNQEFLDEFHQRTEELGKRQDYAKAQEAVNQRQAILEREVKDARTRQQVEEILARQAAERAELQRVSEELAAKQIDQTGLGLGRDTPGGAIVNRKPVVNSRLMGEPAPLPVEAPKPVGLSTGEFGVANKPVERTPVVDSGLMGVEALPEVNHLSTGEGKSATGTPTRKPTVPSGVMGLPAKPVADPFKALTNPAVAPRRAEPKRATVPVREGEKPSSNPWGSIAGIPRSQRGGVNLKEVSNALGKVENAMSKFYGKIPGHKEVMEGFSQRYPNVEQLRKQIIEAGKNSKQYFNNLQSGSSLSAIQTKDPLIKGVSSIMQAAAKRVDHNIELFVRPIEDGLQRLRKADPQAFIDLGEVFKREMLQRKVYSPEQLSQAGFNPEQVQLYTEMRDLYNRTYEAQNAVLEGQSRPKLSKLEYYMASRWKGDWGTSVYGPDGKLMWVIRGDSKAEVQAGLKHLENSGVEFDKNLTKVEYTKKDPQKFADYPAAYSAMVQHLSEHNPMTKAAREAMETMDAEAVFKMLGQNKHFMTKANVRGFIGDRPWVSKFDDINDMFHQQMQYNKNAFEWAEMQQASKMADSLLDDPTIAKQSPDSAQYARDVVDHYVGRGDHQLFNKVEQQLAKSIGRSQSEIRNATTGLKSLWITQKMMTNLGNIFIQNPLQFVNSLAWHRDLSFSGVKHNALKTFASATSDTFAGLSQHYGASLGLDKGMKPVTKIGQDAINYARANGMLDMSVFDEHTDLATPEWQRKYNKTVGRAQIESDKLSRFAAFMGYVHHLDQSGLFPDKMELFREAEHYTRGSMVDNSFKERPFVIQDTGSIGQLGSALQSYSMNYLNQLAGFSRQAAKGNITPLATFLATSAALSGVSGVTGFNWFGDMYDYLRDNSPEAYTSLPDFRKFLYELESDGSFNSIAMTRGIPSAIAGADLGPKFEASLQVPIAGMVTDIGKQATDVTSNLAKGDFAKAAYTVAPAGAAKGALEIGTGAFQDKRTGKYSDTKGNFEKGFYRSEEDKLYKKLGLTSIAEARTKDRIYFRNRDAASNSQATQYFTNKIVKSVFDGDQINDRAIQKLAQVNPEALNNLGKAIEKEALARGMDDQALAVVKMKTLPQIQRYMNYADK